MSEDDASVNQQQHSHDAASLLADISTMKSDMRDMKAVVHKIAEAVTKLAILEDRQTSQTTLMEKVLTRVENVEDRLRQFELRLAMADVQIQRIAVIDQQVLDHQNRLSSIHAAGKTATVGIKAVWAVIGSAAGGAIAWVVTKALGQ